MLAKDDFWSQLEAKGAFESLQIIPFVLAETLGKKYDSANLATLFGVIMSMPNNLRKSAARIGIKAPFFASILLEPEKILRAFTAALRYRSIMPFAALTPQVRFSEKLFQELLSHPEGMWIGKLDIEGNIKR